MQIPNTPSLVFLAYLLFVLPWMAIRSKARLTANPSQLQVAAFRKRIWRSTILMLSLLLAFSIVVADTFDYFPFRSPPTAGPVLGWSSAALVACLFIFFVGRLLRSAEERRRLLVFSLKPRDTQEWILKMAVAVVAGIAEEAAYRGVAVQILWYSLGSLPAAIAISATAFSIAHYLQGWKSMLLIFFIAIVMHGLVHKTGTLLGAMAVHTIYDIIAMIMIASSKRDK